MMSTRAAIGRIKADSFEARYHHHDGYPTGLGRTFLQRALAAPDLEAFLHYVVDEHTTWSSFWDNAAYDACHCHTYGEGVESGAFENPITDCDLFIEWAYAIDAETRRMGVWASVEDPSRDEMIGSDYVEPGYRGVLVTAFSIDAVDIDWEEIERRGRELKDEYAAKALLVTDRLYDTSWMKGLPA